MSIKDQPPPKQNDGKPIWELVISDAAYLLAPGFDRDRLIADMSDRDRVGRERYGTPLQANNGRDAMVDAYQEALDLCVYLKQASEEGMPVSDMAWKAIQMASALRARIFARDGR